MGFVIFTVLMVATLAVTWLTILTTFADFLFSGEFSLFSKFFVAVTIALWFLTFQFSPFELVAQ